MDPSPARRMRWAVGGALILALLAIVLGGVFTVVISLFTGQLAPDSGWLDWVRVLWPAILAWGLGALPFGAALGFFASLIWREV
ncbi:ABC transporter ATP-binding protein [Chloroflexus sp.]|uniref:ABC transporter ATP-binding protein n=1 Tax=Chloroflexus sp. TaxID=1904827 RepID=UPI002ACEA6B0|nr:ABC transporter ATP-binding protein [Chloroflexus sp.]